MLSPDIISRCLEGRPHQLIMILECESRPNESRKFTPPKFCISSQGADCDPRNVPANTLANWADIPNQIMPGIFRSTHEKRYKYYFLLLQ